MLKRYEVAEESLWFPQMGMSINTGQPMTSGTPPTSISKSLGLPIWEAIIRSAVQATVALNETIKNFWGRPVRLVFFGASTKTHYFWRGDDYHVSQLMLGSGDAADSDAMALLRLSDTACSSLLAQALGTRISGPRGFSFKQLSPLEATILNEFSRDILASFMKALVKKQARSLKTETVHLVWLIQIQESTEEEPTDNVAQAKLQFKEPAEIGKIVLSLPAHAIKLKSSGLADVDAEETMVPDDFFFHVLAPARIYLGSTRLALSDLNQLEREDVIILEDSRADCMYLIEPESGTRLPFQAEIRQKQSLFVPYTQEFAMMEAQQQVASARQNLWDNLMVEVNAEFTPVKLPLKQLKQMSEGLVIEVGDLVHNQICLQVEGKTLAWGELIIVGDKFGIRVSRVDGAEATVEKGDEAAQAVAAPPAVIPPVEAAAPPADDPNVADANELDNFLNDDFDEEEEDW